MTYLCTLRQCTDITYHKHDIRYTLPGKTTPGMVYFEQCAGNRHPDTISVYTAPVCKEEWDRIQRSKDGGVQERKVVRPETGLQRSGTVPFILD